MDIDEGFVTKGERNLKTENGVFDNGIRLLFLRFDRRNQADEVIGASSQLASVTDPLGHTWTLTLDGNGNATKITDPLGHHIDMTYNSAGQLTLFTVWPTNDVRERVSFRIRFDRGS